MLISSMWYKEGIFRERWLLKAVFNHEIMYKKFSFAYIDYLSSSKDNKYNQPISAKRKLNQYVGPWKYIHAWKNEPLILIYCDWTIIYSHSRYIFPASNMKMFNIHIKNNNFIVKNISQKLLVVNRP